MKLTGKIVSIGRHDRDGEAIDGVLIEVSREQLQQGGILYREVIVHPDYHARTENPEVLNVDLLERERDALAQRATALAVQVSEKTKRLEATIRENERLTRERDEARAILMDPQALWINICRGTVTLPKGIGDVRQWQDRVTRLEVAGDAVAEILDSTTPDVNCRCHIAPPCSDCVDHGASREALADWLKAKEAKP